MSWPRTGLNDVVRNSTFIQCSLVDWQAAIQLCSNCCSEVTPSGDSTVKSLSQPHSFHNDMPVDIETRIEEKMNTEYTDKGVCGSGGTTPRIRFYCGTTALLGHRPT